MHIPGIVTSDSAIRIERMLEKIEARLVPPPRKVLRVRVTPCFYGGKHCCPIVMTLLQVSMAPGRSRCGNGDLFKSQKL
jgi:hypothetical protein